MMHLVHARTGGDLYRYCCGMIFLSCCVYAILGEPMYDVLLALHCHPTCLSYSNEHAGRGYLSERTNFARGRGGSSIS